MQCDAQTKLIYKPIFFCLSVNSSTSAWKVSRNREMLLFNLQNIYLHFSNYLVMLKLNLSIENVITNPFWSVFLLIHPHQNEKCLETERYKLTLQDIIMLHENDNENYKPIFFSLSANWSTSAWKVSTNRKIGKYYFSFNNHDMLSNCNVMLN